ncbi:MAG: glycosyltransferase, partial [Gemmatimonadetes bacterium]|nr:glycosyltransferase [Gemmatimonadota bacterium]NIQ58172.1 glycosyltransferase [Gemmatimonadota bacterium]NIX47310.1 glycosyltransferase [Gemmatimonadota bacterium]
LQGARVLHVNATAVGGGVAEMLLSLVPLMQQAGLEAEWYVLEAEDRFFEVTKGYHNALQGRPTRWRPADFDLYWSAVERNARIMERELESYDFVVVHDPQPLVLASLLRGAAGAGTRWLWRCHIDLTSPSLDTWNVLSPHLAQYDQLVFSSEAYAPAGLEAERIEFALPCIDPFRAKNRPVRAWERTEVLRRYGIDLARPYLLQVSRFDPWKDPLGVLEVYRRVREARPELQLVYMAAMAADDPEGWGLYRETKSAAGGDRDVHLLALDVPPSEVNRNALEVNAMQRGAAVVLQKSIREGFGLVVTESLWKEKAVVAGNVGGIRLQVRDGWNGYLVESVEEAADRVLRLMDDEETRRLFGRRGRDVVATHFLFTRLLKQYLTWFGRLR